jgi:hypothetical protein
MRYPLDNYASIPTGYKFGSRTFYSDFHYGIDKIAPRDTPIYAPTSGRVTHTIGTEGGNTVHLIDEQGHLWRFMHLWRFGPKTGAVAEGEVIGLFLKDEIIRHFKERKIEVNLKYIDPSYIIRSVPAAPEDRVFCLNLGRHAVHAGMAGKTGMVVASWHQSFVHLPMSLVTRGRRKVDPTATSGAR